MRLEAQLKQERLHGNELEAEVEALAKELTKVSDALSRSEGNVEELKEKLRVMIRES
jgi:septal ring factor EnvC (AmiA/AmiB activator)